MDPFASSFIECRCMPSVWRSAKGSILYVIVCREWHLIKRVLPRVSDKVHSKKRFDAQQSDRF
jgi:hypothetical protein